MRNVRTAYRDNQYRAVRQVAGRHDRGESGDGGSDIASRPGGGVDDDEFVGRAAVEFGARVERDALSRRIELREGTKITRDIGDDGALVAAVEIHQTHHLFVAGPDENAAGRHDPHSR